MSESIEYVTDEHANRKAVIIPYPEWQKILEAMEELDDIRAYDRAKADSDDEELPFDQAIAEIKSGQVK